MSLLLTVSGNDFYDLAVVALAADGLLTSRVKVVGVGDERAAGNRVAYLLEPIGSVGRPETTGCEATVAIDPARPAAVEAGAVETSAEAPAEPLLFYCVGLGAGGFFGNGGQSPVGQPWNSQSSDPATWYSLSFAQCLCC